jgi:hypothetical protein
MKIAAEVIAAETVGDDLRLRLRGHAETDAAWRPWLRLTIHIPDQQRNRRAFYVGRKVTITVDAQP